MKVKTTTRKKRKKKSAEEQSFIYLYPIKSSIQQSGGAVFSPSPSYQVVDECVYGVPVEEQVAVVVRDGVEAGQNVLLTKLARLVLPKEVNESGVKGAKEKVRKSKKKKRAVCVFYFVFGGRSPAISTHTKTSIIRLTIYILLTIYVMYVHI